MEANVLAFILFVAASVSAALAAFKATVLPRVEKVALAVALAAAGFAALVSDAVTK